MRSQVLFGVLTGLAGCAAQGGDECTLDSDCDNDLLCYAGTCQTPVGVQLALNDIAEPSASKDSGPAMESDPGQLQPEECANVVGVFEAGAAPCPQPNEIWTLTSLVIEAKGGFQKLAGVSNPAIEKGLVAGCEEDCIVVEARVDGSFQVGCTRVIAWWSEAGDLNADCTGLHIKDTFPFPLPFGWGTAVMRDVTFDQATGLLTGYVDPEEAKEALPNEDLKTTFDMLFVRDVDLDGDQVPDVGSVTATLSFKKK